MAPARRRPPIAMAKRPSPVTPGTVERFARPMSVLAGVMLVRKIVRGPFLRCFRKQLHDFFRRHALRLVGIADPYLIVTVTVTEHDGDDEGMKSGDAYEQARAYLGDRCALRARQLRAGSAPGGDRFVLSLGDGEEVADEFHGATVWWHSVSAPRRDKDAGGRGRGRAYQLVFHRRHRELVVSSYLPHVCREGRAVMVAGRCRKLFTNAGGLGYSGRSIWRHVAFEHPSTFETLAMDPTKKKDIMDALDAFRNGKEYYARVGKAWKRGYLLYGLTGTGKSSMIAAMANYLDYDIYDIELTSVYTNTELRRMFIETTSKSITVIEDIDCSLDLTSKRKKKKEKHAAPSDRKSSKVTLSGLLNFVDGLWSACGGERVVVFTTNHVEKLGPALIRPGRMDKHIEMSYCCFEAFRFLAKNYLAVDAHPLFDNVLREVNFTPAHVAELLTPKRAAAAADEGSCLAGLVKALQEEAKKKATAKTGGGSYCSDDEEIVDPANQD